MFDFADLVFASSYERKLCQLDSLVQSPAGVQAA